VLAGDRDAVADALNLVDDSRPERREAAFEMLVALERELPSPGAARVGVTGAPGAGKSTLLDALVRTLRGRGETVGVVAVDPSSRRSGGALLGDRIRLRSRASDPGVFFRSMAARERLGGLADATRASALVLAGAFDRVFVETVGVGQSESDVTGVADTLLYVAQPGAGDMLQFMKAGVLELPDVFAVNKADQGGEAERTAAELAAGLGLSTSDDAGWTPPVLKVSARDGQGIEAVLDALDAHRAHLERGGELARRRRRADEAWALEALEVRFGSFGLEAVGGRAAVAARLAEGPLPSAFAAVRTLSAEIQEALRKS
jgi:LAO/AO transport system kinase